MGIRYKTAVSVLSCVLMVFQSCWSDVNVKEYNIVGDYKVIRDSINDNSSGYILALKSLDGGYKYILENCIEVKTDSINIYVKSIFLKKEIDYSVLKLKSLVSLDDALEYKKKKIDKREFDKLSLKCKECIVIDFMSIE